MTISSTLQHPPDFLWMRVNSGNALQCFVKPAWFTFTAAAAVFHVQASSSTAMYYPQCYFYVQQAM